MDPTRPPPEALPAVKAPTAADVAASQDKKDDVGIPAGAPPVQLLLVGPTRRFAIIRGQLVDVGPKSKDVRLVELRPDEITLRSAEGTENLRLFPDVEKRVSKAREAETKSAPAKKPKDKK